MFIDIWDVSQFLLLWRLLLQVYLLLAFYCACTRVSAIHLGNELILAYLNIPLQDTVPVCLRECLYCNKFLLLCIVSKDRVAAVMGITFCLNTQDNFRIIAVLCKEIRAWGAEWWMVFSQFLIVRGKEWWQVIWRGCFG